MDKSIFLPSRKACKILGVHADYLRKMDDLQKIQTIRTIGNKRLYNVNQFIEDNISFKLNEPLNKKTFCYCRVSTPKQKEDLERQVAYMKEKYPDIEIIKDIGSGINFKRKGLLKILDYAHRGLLNEVIIAYKDRLCRFGFELFQHLLKEQSNAVITILNDEPVSKEEEVVQDILQILTIFSARVNGLRSYSTKIRNDKNLNVPKS
jgi:predicted site-specific integrase-resolvase